MIIVCDVNPVRHIRRPWVTWALMLACLVVTPAVWFGPEALRELILVRERQLHPALLTYALVHAGPLHLVGNLLVLWAFGDNVEDAMGHARFALFAAASAALSAEGEFLLSPDSTSIVGSSGIGAATMGAYLMLHPRAHVAVWLRPAWPPVPAFFPAAVVVGTWVSLNVMSALLLPDSRVAWWAHVVGFVAGALLVVVLRRRDVPLLQPPQTPEQLLTGLSRIKQLMLRAGTFRSTDRGALEVLAGRSPWLSAGLFVGLMVLGEVLFG